MQFCRRKYASADKPANAFSMSFQDFIAEFNYFCDIDLFSSIHRQIISNLP